MPSDFATNPGMPVVLRYRPEVASDVKVMPGAPKAPPMALKAAVIPACPSRVRQSDKPVAMSVKFWLTAAESIVVFGTNVLTVVKVPLPLKGMAASYFAAAPLISARMRVLACWGSGVAALEARFSL